MLQFRLPGTLVLPRRPPFVVCAFCRHKSVTAAIERGKRGSRGNLKRASRRQVKYELDPQGRVQLLLPKSSSSWKSGSLHRTETTEEAQNGRRENEGGTWSNGREKDEGARKESLPYTTAASEFLYGYSSVLAAVKAGRRKLYKLYVHERGLNHAGGDAMIARAKDLGVNIQEVGNEYLRAMDKASSGRPHNGFILEASPLPVPPITELRNSSIRQAIYKVALDRQSKEDAEVNGTQEEFAYTSANWRHPLILYVDGVVDEGNLGAIARSAYFLGVDGIVTPSRQSAPWSHITLKASAGAAEAIPIFRTNQPSDLLGRSARNGWRIYASDVIPPAQEKPLFASSSTSQQSLANFASSVIFTYSRSSKRLPADHCPVDSHPTILMMGAEGTGLRTSLLNQAHYKVGIRHGRQADEVGVDSLNVSVAASLLSYHILQKPRPLRRAGDLLF